MVNNGIETIIAGIDSATGSVVPHVISIYKSQSGDGVVNCDSVGFAAVGIGARHAESQFMLAGHSRYSPMPETLLLTYLAKKRSEVAPGVGEGTDMFTIGAGLGSLCMLSAIEDFDIKEIASIYEKVETGQRHVLEQGKRATKKYIGKIFKKREAQKKQQQQNIPSAGEVSPSPSVPAPPSSQSASEPMP